MNMVKKHDLGWTDDYMGGVYCPEHERGDGYFDISANEAPTPCPFCGKLLTLVWDTHLEEFEEGEDAGKA
jgi:hypothetical protein